MNDSVIKIVNKYVCRPQNNIKMCGVLEKSPATVVILESVSLTSAQLTEVFWAVWSDCRLIGQSRAKGCYVLVNVTFQIGQLNHGFGGFVDMVSGWINDMFARTVYHTCEVLLYNMYRCWAIISRHT